MVSRETRRFDSFERASKERTARAYGVESANCFARRPQ